MPADMLYPW